MKQRVLTVMAAALVFGWAGSAQAGPAMGDDDGGSPSVPGQSRGLSGGGLLPDESGAATPSFSDQNSPGAAPAPPEAVPDGDTKSSLSDGDLSGSKLDNSGDDNGSK